MQEQVIIIHINPPCSAKKLKNFDTLQTLSYFLLLQDDTKDSFCIVEKVNAQGPAHGLLRPGDLVHSVDSKAIVDQVSESHEIMFMLFFGESGVV